MCVHTDGAHTGAARTQPALVLYGAFRNRSLFYLCEGVRTAYSGLARGEEFRAGGRIVNCYEVDFAPEIPKYISNNLSYKDLLFFDNFFLKDML